MKIIFPSASILLLAGPAYADPGHIAMAGGHSHWIALAALVAAGVIAGALLLNGKVGPTENAEESADAEKPAGPEAQEA